MALMNTDAAQRGLWLGANWLIWTASLPARAVKNIKGNEMNGSLSVFWFIAPHFHLIAG